MRNRQSESKRRQNISVPSCITRATYLTIHRSRCESLQFLHPLEGSKNIRATQRTWSGVVKGNRNMEKKKQAASLHSTAHNCRFSVILAQLLESVAMRHQHQCPPSPFLSTPRCCNDLHSNVRSIKHSISLRPTNVQCREIRHFRRWKQIFNYHFGAVLRKSLVGRSNMRCCTLWVVFITLFYDFDEKTFSLEFCQCSRCRVSLDYFFHPK